MSISKWPSIVSANRLSSLADAVPTGDVDQDTRNRKRHETSCHPPDLYCDANVCTYSLEEELARLEKNKDRRLAREKAKGITAPSPADSAMSPDDAVASTGRQAPQGTQRKCANCGQVGHIKTNKKYTSPYLCLHCKRHPPSLEELSRIVQPERFSTFG